MATRSGFRGTGGAVFTWVLAFFGITPVDSTETNTDQRLLRIHDVLRALAAVTLMAWFFVSLFSAAGTFSA